MPVVRDRDGWVGLFELRLFAANVFVFGSFLYVSPITQAPRMIALPGDIDAEDPRLRSPSYRNRVWAEYYEVGGVFRASPDASDPDHGR